MFSCKFFVKFWNIFFIDHLRTAASETFSENSLGNSAQDNWGGSFETLGR